MNRKVLCVDDDPRVLTAYQRNLADQFVMDIALSGDEALKLLAGSGPYAVVVADMRMPNMDGIEMLIRAQKAAPETVRIMLTGNADQLTAVDAVNKGQVYRFLNKPCPPDILALALDAAIHRYHSLVAERELMESTLNGSVQVLIDVLSLGDPAHFATGQKLRDYTRVFAQSLQLEQIWELELAAMLSRIAYVTIPHSVLQKHRSGFGLTGLEKETLQRLPEIGAHLLSNVPRLKNTARIVLYQDKHFDGSGFPCDLLAGENIPVGARILKLLSDLIQLEAKGVPRLAALEQLRGRAGRYDPNLLDAALICFAQQLPNSHSSLQQKRAVMFLNLKAGDILAEQIESNDGMVIAGAGLELTQTALEKIRNFVRLSRIKEPIYVAA